MDEMEDYELRDVVDNLKYLDRNSWEQTRLSIYSNVQINTKKKLKPKDVLSFPWEDDDDKTSEDKHEKEISDADIERLKQRSKKIQQMNKNGK